MSGNEFTVKHKHLPTEERRLEMAKFINARRGMTVKWLMNGSVYRLMAIHKEEVDKQAVETTEYQLRQYNKLEHEPKPLKPHKLFRDGIWWVLGDNGEYTMYYN